jgi:hypothetical protein
MGIAALASPLPQLQARDAWIGWTTDAVLAGIVEGATRWDGLRGTLLAALAAARGIIRDDDLRVAIGCLDGAAAETRLRELADAAAGGRHLELRDLEVRRDRGESRSSARHELRDDAGERDWRGASETPLFVHKRAKTLADILFAERVLGATEAASSLLDDGRDGDRRRALSIALREVRKFGIASRLLDLSVCGAVPPYRELVVGKLVALAAGSDEAAAYYRDRYKTHVSEIASKMAGRAVTRPPDLCALTTTSLYGAASSQYNRLRVRVPEPTGCRIVEWADLGATQGFGTLHLSEDTVDALRRVSIDRRRGRVINNAFGEGSSPRLRQVRQALEDLGIDGDAILRHESVRQVYGLELGSDGRQALLSNRPRRHGPPGFAAVTAAWAERWLASRITRATTLEQVSLQGPATVCAELSGPPSGQLSLFR